jgi:hypothetical protein
VITPGNRIQPKVPNQVTEESVAAIWAIKPRNAAAHASPMLGHAYSLLGFKIVEGVVGAGFPQKPSHSAVFAQIKAEGSRLTDLARGANITPQAKGELVDELEDLGERGHRQLRTLLRRLLKETELS